MTTMERFVQAHQPWDASCVAHLDGQPTNPEAYCPLCSPVEYARQAEESSGKYGRCRVVDDGGDAHFMPHRCNLSLREDGSCPWHGPITAATPDKDLDAALAEVGRAIEALPADERHARVRDALSRWGFHPADERATTFLTGVFVSAHERRLFDASFPGGVRLDELVNALRKARRWIASAPYSNGGGKGKMLGQIDKALGKS